MAARGRDVLIGKLYYRTKKGNGSLKKVSVVSILILANLQALQPEGILRTKLKAFVYRRILI